MSDPAARQANFENPQPGDMLAGKYRVDAQLGKGGMGVVVAATHTQLGQRVAIKYLLRPDVEEIVARFLREARAAVRLRNEHVARVLDVGEFDNGAPYMVMEYLVGGDLAHHLKASGPLPIEEAVDYLLQTCEAIAEAHAAGIVHRDLKPANLFLMTTPDGSKCVKVLDFGISKVSDNEQGSDGMQLTKTEMVLGSPLYMSTEQIKSSRDVDARSDVWALGVILYQLLAGKVPFNAQSFSELVLKISLDAPPPISQYRSDVPAGLEAAVLKCLEKNRDNRFQNVAEFALAIAEFGPPMARASAEKARRMLESAGHKVEAPARREQSSASITVPTSSTPSGATNAPSNPAPPQPESDTQSSLKTAVMSKSAPGSSTSDGAAKGRGGVVIAIAALGVVIAAGAAFFVKGSAKEQVDPAAAATEKPLASATATSQPEVKPVNTQVEAPSPVAVTSSSAASVAPVAPVAPSNRPVVTSVKSAPTGQSTATPTSTSTNILKTFKPE